MTTEMETQELTSTTDRYLAMSLEGAESTLPQLDNAIQQLTAQLEQLTGQREEVLTAITELRDLLGLTDENGNSESEE